MIIVKEVPKNSIIQSRVKVKKKCKNIPVTGHGGP
jgi:hypothetical protein